MGMVCALKSGLARILDSPCPKSRKTLPNKSMIRILGRNDIILLISPKIIRSYGKD